MIDKYLGLDISPTVINKCRELYKNDLSKAFRLVNEYNGELCELGLSYHVIFHLVIDEDFDQYMKSLFYSSNKHIQICSPNKDTGFKEGLMHLRHRKWSDWVDKNESKSWSLMRKKGEFYLYKKIENSY